MKKILKCFLLFLFVSEVNYGQSLSLNDFKIGSISLNKSIWPVVKHYGKPVNKDSIDGYISYSYPDFTIWLDETNHKINAFQIIHPNIKASRGIAINDSVQKIIRLFGKPGETGEKFERPVGVYDFSFSDYSAYLDYYYESNIYDSHYKEYYPWHIIFYLKENKIARILYFIEVFE